MKIKINIIRILVLLILVSCNDHFEMYSEVDGSKNFMLTTEYTIDKELCGSIGDVTFYKNNICFSSMYNQAIYRLNLENRKIDTLGRNGMGPNEYISPTFIYYGEKSNFLYYSDGANHLVKTIHLPDLNPEKSQRYLVCPSTGMIYFIVIDDYIFYRNPLYNPRLNRYSITDGDNLISISEMKPEQIDPHLFWEQLAADTVNRYIYSANYDSYVITKYDYDLNPIGTWDFRDLKEIVPMNQKTKNKAENGNMDYDIVKYFTSVVRLFTMYLDNEIYIISALKNKGFLTEENRLNQYNIYHIIDSNGQILVKIKDDDRYLLEIKDDQWYFLNYAKSNNSDRYEYIEVYEFSL